MAKTNGTLGTPEKGPKWREPFLTALANSGNVLVACRHAKVKRRTAYNHRAKFPNFREKWDEAIEEAVDLLEVEAQRRAVKGVEKPIYYKGARIDTVKEYSDTLLIFLMKANRPEKYRDNFDLKKIADDLASIRAAAGQPAAVPPKGDRAAD